MSQSQNIGWIRQKPHDNYQTIRIVSESFVQFFLTHTVKRRAGYGFPQALNYINTYSM